MRILAFILLACATLMQYISYASNTPYIVRHVDNEITPLSVSQIDSITFSHYDCDSIYHNNIISQIIWTPDSIYIMPLSEIDKVDLTIPANKLRKDVTDIKDNLYNYVTGCINDTVLMLSARIPTGLLPKVGDNLVYDEMDERLPIGFIGKVSAIENGAEEIKCICERTSLSEIYDTYYNYSDTKLDIPEETSIKKAPPEISDRTLSLAEVSGTISLSKHANPWDCALLETSANLETGIRIKPTMRVRHMRLVENPRVYESCLIITEIGAETFMSLSCQADISKKFPIGKAGVNLPVAPFIRLEAEGGISVGLNGKIGLKANHGCGIRFTMQCDYDNARLVNPLRLNQVSMGINDPYFNAELFGEAEFKLAGYFEIGMALITGDLAKVSAYEEGGLKISVDAPIEPSHILNCSTSTDLYNDLCSSKLKAAPFYAWGMESEAVKGKFRYKEEIGATVLPDIFDTPLLPTIYNSRFSHNSMGYGEFSANINRHSLLKPTEWGAAAFEINPDGSVSDNISAEYSRDYGNPNLLSYKSYLEPVSKTDKFRVFPTLKMFGRTILAEPYVDVDPESVDDRLIEGEVYTTGECRQYFNETTGARGAFGMVCTAMTPSISFKDLSLNYNEIEECRWEWGLDHPILSNGNSPDYDFWDENASQGWGYGWNYYRTPVFSQEMSVGERLQPIQVFFPSHEGYDTPAIIHPNSIVEFYDNRFYLRLAVKLKSGKTIYPLESRKDFTYSYKCELRFKDFDFSYERESNTKINYEFTVKGVYSGVFAICNSYWLGGISVSDGNDMKYVWSTDNKYAIPGYIANKLDYRLIKKADYTELNPRERTEISLGPAQGFTLYHAEYIDDCYDAPEKFQKNEPYFYWDTTVDEKGTIFIIDHNFGIRDKR